MIPHIYHKGTAFPHEYSLYAALSGHVLSKLLHLNASDMLSKANSAFQTLPTDTKYNCDWVDPLKILKFQE